TAYNLCLGVVVPASAWLGDRLGLKRLYLASLVGFRAASVLCGVAGDLTSEIVFRILQAVPGGMLPVTCMTILYRIVMHVTGRSAPRWGSTGSAWWSPRRADRRSAATWSSTPAGGSCTSST